jgi:diguanylate cyclase (GGDEF)-like protein
LRRLVPCSLCIFYLYDVDSDELVAAHAAGDNASLFAGLRIGRGERLSGWVAANRQSIRNSDPILDLGEYARSVPVRPRSCLSTPMIANGTLVGVLSLYSIAPEAFSEEHQRIVEVISRQVSSILNNAAEFDRTKAVSLRDQLTGLPNIEQLRQLTRLELSSDHSGEPITLLLIDVKGLERINIEHGRQEGDAILSKVVRATRRSLRAADMLFRYRDDEFIALLLHTERRTGNLITSRVQEAIRTEAIEHGEPRFEVTVVTVSAPEDGQSIDQLVERAGRVLKRPLDTTDPGYPSSSIH